MAPRNVANLRGTSTPRGYACGLAGLVVLVAAAAFASRAGARGGDGLLPIATTDADFFQHGTQPEMIDVVPIVSAVQCRVCHGDYEPEIEPYRNWSASMLGQSARDPMFWANLDIVNQDSVDAGQFCMRCHTPGAFLAGRTDPPDGSQMLPEDFEGVSCNVCHRVVDPIYVEGTSPPQDEGILQALADNMDYVPEGLLPPEGGNARYIIDPTDSRRGPLDPATIPFNPHFGVPQPELILSPHHQSSEVCWTCHDVSNPLLELQPDDTYVLGNLDERHVTGSQDQMFPLHRTYSEWLNSWYNTLGGVQHNGRFGGNHPTGVMNVCQDCHMPDQQPGFDCNLGAPFVERQRPAQHSFIGSNTWVLGAIRDLFDDSETGLSEASVLEARARNIDLLENASDLELEQVQSLLKARLTNRTGHKLPTGFPDGRRVWVNVTFFDDQGAPLSEYGAYDFGTAELTEEDTTVFECVLGIDAAQSQITGLPEGPTFHIALANVIEKDNRIPAIGHSNIVAEESQTLPVGETYANGQHWHDSFFAIPQDAVDAVVTVYYQTTSKPFADFLLAEGGARGQIAYDLWVDHGRSAPVVMDLVNLALRNPADINQDGVVDFVDLLLLIQFWGSCPPPPVVCPPDINNDGMVDFGDLVALLGSWTSDATGACCFTDGSCLVLVATECLAQGGEYAGDDVTCIDANCPQPPTGACCFDDGSCLVLEEIDCLLQSGTYAGDDVTCIDANCPQPATGACCLDDGLCKIVSEADCATQGGMYQGDDVPCEFGTCPIPTGACCFIDGACEILSEAMCFKQGGTYAGQDVTCLDADCPQPTGACCFDDGSCLVLEAADCATQGGTYAGDDIACIDANCPQPTGACCFDDGSCLVLEAADCATQGGTYAGDDVTCIDADCLQSTGACCFDDGSCLVLEAADCATQGGNYAGDDIACIDANCPQPTGACCFDDGSCLILEAADCATQGGTYAGDDIACIDANCPQPTGACCFDDGSCLVLEAADCATQGGTYAGDDIACIDANCPQPTGACCFDDGSCLILEAADCATQGGTYAGDDIACIDANCPQPTGACCFDDGSCLVLEAADCATQGGNYAGDDIACIDANCPQPTGACCFDDGSCLVLEAADCATQGGTYAGDDIACIDANCPQPTGACCFGDGSCLVLEAADCATQGGNYAGDDIACIDANCPQPTGACCFDDGSCLVLEQTDCNTQGGTYAGDDVTCIDANCPQPTGACCFDDGSCLVLEQTDCNTQGGTYAGDDVTCIDANCPQPTGACCFDDGSCLVLEQADCNTQGGTYAGDDITCPAANCPQPTGACCLGDGSCAILEAADCNGQGGDYQGDDTTCAGDPCQIVVLFVVIDAGAPTAQEAARQTLMEGWGFAVQRITATDSQAAYDAAVAISDVAYVSEEITSGNVGTKLTDAPIGVVNEESALVDELRLAAGSEAPTLSQVDVVSNAHPITSPFGLGLMDVLNSAQPGSVLLPPLASGVVLTETDSSGTFQASLLAVETGSTLYPDGIAAGRRVHLPFGSGTFDVNELNDDGRLIMRRAIEWSAGIVPIAGACCLDSGPCLFLTSDECATQGGVYAGDDVRCIDAGCAAPTGACCFGDGSCAVLEQADCTTQGGTYAGDDVTCVDANCPQPTIVEVRVSTGSDDAEENSSNGATDLTSSDLELPVSGDPTDTVGMRFPGLSIPAGATIEEAWIQFQVDEVSTGSVAMTLRGQNTGDAATFTTSTSNITSRARTTASVAWSPPDWNTVGEAGANQRTPDLSAIVQAIVDLGGWSSGNAMVFIVDGTGRRTAESFNGVSSAAALLHVAYSELGACCLDDVNCVELSPTHCAAQGGTYRGSGVSCQGVDCSINLGVDCCANGPVRVLHARYTADDCSASNTDQDGGARCADFAPMLDMVFIRATEKGNPDDLGGLIWFEGIVGVGETFAVRAAFPDDAEASRLKDTTYFHVFDPTGTILLQTVQMRTKCDKPLLTGDQIGSVLVLDCLGENEGSCCDFGRPRILTMEYTGEDCSATRTGQDSGDASCDDFGALPATVYILASDNADPDATGALVWFTGSVSNGATYDLDAANAGEARLGDKTWIHVFDVQGGTHLQTVKFKTKCDRPLYVGHQFGSALLRGCVGETE